MYPYSQQAAAQALADRIRPALALEAAAEAAARAVVHGTMYPTSHDWRAAQEQYGYRTAERAVAGSGS